MFYATHSTPSRVSASCPETCLLMHTLLASFTSPFHISICLLEFLEITSFINYLHSNLHFRLLLGKPKQRQPVILSKSRTDSKNHMNDNLYMVQGLLSLQFASEVVNIECKKDTLDKERFKDMNRWLLNSSLSSVPRVANLPRQSGLVRSCWLSAFYAI